MSKPSGWLNAWEDEADERRALAPSPAAPEPPEPEPHEPALFVDDFGGSHCFECSTVYRPEDDGDTCPTCGAGAS